MAKTVSVLQASDIRSLKRAHAALTDFLIANGEIKPATPAARASRPARKRSHKKKGATAAAPGLKKDGTPKKPTGAAAHKKKPGDYPPVKFDEQQQQTLKEQAAAGSDNGVTEVPQVAGV